MTTASANQEAGVRSIDGIERKLSSSFTPLEPRADFVRRVKKRLIENPTLKVEQSDSTGAAIGLLGIVVLLLSLLFGRWLWRYLFKPESSED